MKKMQSILLVVLIIGPYSFPICNSCSRKHFSEKQAEQWWSENQARVYEQYHVQMVDKSSAGIGDVDASRF